MPETGFRWEWRLQTATIADVARAAGVSKSTVSKVLNGRTAPFPVSDATGRRAAERLIDRIDGQDDSDADEVFPMELVVRRSTGTRSATEEV